MLLHKASGNSVEFPSFLFMFPDATSTLNKFNGNSVVVASPLFMFPDATSTLNKFDAILCIEEPISSLPDSTVFARTSRMIVTLSRSCPLKDLRPNQSWEG